MPARFRRNISKPKIETTKASHPKLCQRTISVIITLPELIEGRVDALILAEAGICRLRTTGVLDEHNEHLTAYRIHSEDWPTAPGQGTVSIHCKTERFEP